VVLPAWLTRTSGALFSLVFPEDCRVCGSALRNVSRIPVCQVCLAAPEPVAAESFCVECRTPFVNPFPLDEQGRCALCRLGLRGFDSAYNCGVYEGTLRKLIHLFKYSGIRTLARPLGEFLATSLPRDERFDIVVPMPLHWWRRWRRGFNQSGLPAEEIARRSGIPVRSAVRRARATRPQTGLSDSKRRANVAGAFSVRRGVSLQGLRVLLVDDVMTTGATAAACARALKRAGAARVALLTVARADRRLQAVGTGVA